MRIRWGSRIGSGGFGEVFSATDVEHDEEVAVKRLLPGWAADERTRRRFVREVRMQASINHPNVMPILGKKLSGDRPWYVMLKAKRDLAEAVRGENRTDDWIAKTLLAILAGAEAAHDAGVIHRDIKPQNVLELEDGTWVLSDFGAAREIDRTTTTLTRSAEGIGTIDYMPLEQYQDPSSTDRRCDIFALGKLLLFMVVGEVREPFRPSTIPGGSFGPIVDRATQTDPTHRYQSVTEMKAAVADASAPTTYESPRRTLERLRDEVGKPGAGSEVLRQAAAFLTRHSDVAEFHQELTPYIPIPLLERLRDEASDTFRWLIETFDEHVSGGLSFSYCDVVADFYSSLAAAFDDPWIFQLVIRRLLDMGWSHNRWHVQDVVRAILRRDLTAERIRVAREAILENAEASRWTFEEGEVYDFPDPIIDAINRVGDSG
jgi:serine/threonine protein kinase